MARLEGTGESPEGGGRKMKKDEDLGDHGYSADLPTQFRKPGRTPEHVRGTRKRRGCSGNCEEGVARTGNILSFCSCCVTQCSLERKSVSNISTDWGAPAADHLLAEGRCWRLRPRPRNAGPQGLPAACA